MHHPLSTRIPLQERAQYDWPLAVRARWRNGAASGFGDIVRVNRTTLELTDSKGGGKNVTIDKMLVFELVNF